MLREWNGAWAMAVVVAAGRSAAARAELRAAMAGLRLVELREGTWLRPDNLDPQRLPSARAVVATQCRWFEVRLPGNAQASARLAADLWNLDAWARRAEKLRREMDRLVTRVEKADSTTSARPASFRWRWSNTSSATHCCRPRCCRRHGRGTPYAPTTSASTLPCVGSCPPGRARSAPRRSRPPK